MPLKWERDRNPYVSNYFGKLKIGPNIRRRQITATAQELNKSLASGQEAKCAGGHPLDVHAVNKAANQLMESGTHAEELLLVHSQPQREDKKELKKLVNQLRQRAAFANDRSPVPLKHLVGVFWFLPAPGPESAELPPWDAFGLVGPGDPDDLASDIIFDS